MKTSIEVTLTEALQETSIRFYNYFTVEEMHIYFRSTYYFWPYHTLDKLHEKILPSMFDEAAESGHQYVWVGEDQIGTVTEEEYLHIMVGGVNEENLVNWALDTPLRERALEFLSDVEDDLASYWGYEKVEIIAAGKMR